MIGMRRFIGVAEAVIVLRPNAQYAVRDNDYDTMEWFSPDITIPTKQEVEAKIVELEAAEPMRVVRTIRDYYLRESDWTQMADVRSRRSQAWQDAWDAYRQELRDITSVAQPTFDENGVIQNVNWPVQPPQTDI
jgi:hypothetical protein